MTYQAYLVTAALGCAALAAGAFGGCSSQVSYSPGAGAGGRYHFITSTSSVGPGPMPSTSSQGGGGGLPQYMDPGCGGAQAVQQFSCDPYHQGNGDCKPGEACDIFVSYPKQQCDKEIYGSECVQAGTGVQGDPCGSAQQCAAGFTCVITGSGTQCVQFCHLDGPSGCPDGMVCEPIDVKGFGGCL